MSKKRPVVERFWEKVEKSESCWIWTAGTNDKGYGRILNNRGELGGEISSHRLSWVIHYGLIPEGLWVLHKCDNPPCVNPDHLFLGTVQDNNRDRDKKGRGINPELCHRGHNEWRIRPDGRRACKACRREYNQNRTDEQKERRRDKRRDFMANGGKREDWNG